MKRAFLPLVLVTFFGLVAPRDAQALDAFDRHTSVWLRSAVKDAMPMVEATQKQIEDLKRLDANTENPCVIIRTNGGNLAKALVSWGLRRTKDKVVPVLLLERYVTYTNGRNDTTSAAGANVMLFPGFAFNFDIGQVVPLDGGADLVYTEAKSLKPVDKAELFGLSGSIVPKAVAGQFDPNANQGVVPEDFAGSWKLNTDGRWQADLQLAVDDEGTVTGKYVSADTKSSYPVDGKITKTVPHRVKFMIDFGNSKQEYEAFLWTKDKSTLAGSTQIDTQRFGFVANREKAAGKAEPKAEPKPEAKAE